MFKNFLRTYEYSHLSSAKCLITLPTLEEDQAQRDGTTTSISILQRNVRLLKPGSVRSFKSSIHP